MPACVEFSLSKQGEIVRSLRLLLPLAVIVIAALTGCATSPLVVGPSVTASANPVQGTAVRIDQVVDARVFLNASGDLATPTLDQSESGDEGYKARIIGRKRNANGNTAGGVLLPPNMTTASLVGNAVAEGFRESGYRVLVPGDAGYEQAVPVKVRVLQFWAWYARNLRTYISMVKISSRAEIRLEAPLPAFREGKTLAIEVTNVREGASELVWQEIINRGLGELAGSVKSSLDDMK